MALRLPFDSSREVSSGLALLFAILLGTVVAWMAVSASTEIVQRAKDMPRTSLDSQSVPGIKAGR